VGHFGELDAITQQRLAEVLETRGADPQQQAMRQAFLTEIPFPAQARVLEVGCGTGVLTRVLGRWPQVAEVFGVDPAPALLAQARELAGDQPKLSFEQGDGRSLPFEGQTFDVVVFDSTLSHVPDPARALAEAPGYCARMADWRPSTATTPPPRSRSATTTPCRPAWRS
jgi:SAM-dependent methyltransferase